MILMIIIFLLLIFIGLILVTPLKIIINTSQKIYEAALVGFIKIQLTKHDEEGIRFKIKVFFFSFYVHPFTSINRKSEKIIKQNIIRRRKIRKKDLLFFKFIFKTSWQIIKRTKVKKFQLNIDTGDVIKNAYLIPGFVLVNKGNWNLSVNYENKNELIISMQHRLYIILWQIIVNFINYKVRNR